MRQTVTSNVKAINGAGYTVQSGRKVSPRMDETGVQWLQVRRAAVKDSTYIKYETVWRCHIQPVLGSLQVDAINTKVTETFIQSLLKKGLAVKTVRDVLAVLRSILAFASLQGCAVQPLICVRCPKEPRKPMRVLTREEQDRLMAYLRQDMDSCHFGIMLALLTGIRLGELCALRWENVSEQDRIIFINSTMQRLRKLDDCGGNKTHVVIGPPKSDAAVRMIPMSDHVAALCREMGPCGPDCFILTGTAQYMEPRAVQFRMKKVTEACGLEGVHFHTLRHTFATRSVEVGFELKSLSEVLGHSNTTITLNRYVHASMELKRANMNKLALAGL